MANWNQLDPTEPATLNNNGRETPRANRALRDYLHLGHTRSLANLLACYTSAPKAPTHSIDTLKKWSLTYSWVNRALSFDAQQRVRENIIFEERRRVIILNGLELKYECIEQLKNVYAQLKSYLNRE